MALKHQGSIKVLYVGCMQGYITEMYTCVNTRMNWGHINFFYILEHILKCTFFKCTISVYLIRYVKLSFWEIMTPSSQCTFYSLWLYLMNMCLKQQQQWQTTGYLVSTANLTVLELLG